MCDTFVALPAGTARGRLLFAKNSDRERNEAQVLEVHAARRGGGDIRLTYLTIPDVAETRPCLISRPFWMWGAEMGANDCGVVIGNEALHAVIPAQRRRALTGMDLLRLALERATSAAEAVEVIVALLETYGQGGDCGHLGRFHYHNGFVIADHAEAYVLETVGKWWVVERVDRARALSNAYSISDTYERVSPGLAAHAEAQGWRRTDGRYDLADGLIDRSRDAVSQGRGRCARGQGLLERGAPGLTTRAMADILRDHGETADWTPARTVGRTICMHAAEGARRSQSVASMISEVSANRTVHWVTGTSAPCTSLFKPVVLQTETAAFGPDPSDRFDGASAWWRHELLHRRLLRDFSALTDFQAERDALEAEFAAAVDAASEATLAEVTADCWRRAQAAEGRWLAALAPAGRSANPPAYSRSWARLNQVAGFPRP